METTTDELANAASTNMVAGSQNGTTVSTLGLGEAFKGLGIKIKNTTASLWTFLTTTPAGWVTALIAAIAAVVAGFALYNKKLEEQKQAIRDAAEEAKSAIDNIKSDFNSLSSTVDDTKKRFAELAQGVENLGKVNQSSGRLTTEDYNEFLDLSNQLAELFPELIRGYDANGNALLGLSGNVNTIVGSLDDLVSVQRELTNQEILNEMPDVWSGYTLDMDEYKESLESNRKMVQSVQDAIAEVELDGATLTIEAGKYAGSNSDPDKAIQEALERMGFGNAGNNWNGTYDVNAKITGTTNWDFSSFSEDPHFIENLKRSLGSISEEYQKEVTSLEAKIGSANSGMSSYINTWLTDSRNFQLMDSGMQNVVKDILMDNKWIDSLPDDIDSKDWNKVSAFLQDNFLAAINDIDSKEIRTALTDAFHGTISSDSLDSVIDHLVTTEGFEQDNPLIIYLQTKLESRENLEEGVKAKVQNEYRDMVNSLSDVELQIASEQIKVDGDTLLTWDELIFRIEEYKKSLENVNRIPLSYTDTLSQIQSLSSALDQLDQIYTDIHDKGDFDWSSILNNESFTKTFGEMGSSYDDFIRTSPGLPMIWTNASPHLMAC